MRSRPCCSRRRYAAVSYEFDLSYDPATAVVSGTQVISFSRSEFGDEAVLLLLNNAGAVTQPA